MKIEVTELTWAEQPSGYSLEELAERTVAPVMPPIGRFIRPEEVAAMTAFLLGPDAGAITGQQIVICGGSSL